MLISRCCNVHRTAEGLLLLSITFTVSVLAFQPVEVVKGLLLMHAHPFFFLHLWGLEAHHSRASHLDLQAAEVSRVNSGECTEDRKEPESPPDRQAARQHVKSA